jgi:2-dehydro-3-deoxyphosphogluconate aldolase / (4S)-4-hydroxy-2-oxoglutarate aldolase
MTKQIFSWPQFEKIPLIGIIRGLAFSEVKKILPVYIASGLTTIEITMNTPSAKKIIRFATDKYAGQLNVGAGTVCNKKDLKEALAAGAQFIVTPILNEKVVRHCADKKIPVFPGAFTPTEIYRAWELGASMVKVYPATSLGPGYIKDVKAPLNQIKLLPTGGINKENLSLFMKAGADGLGIGSQLFHKQYIQTEDWDALKKHFEEFTEYFRPEIKTENPENKN